MSALEVRGLDVRVGGAPLLRGASLAVERGEAVLLTGPSGSGKSTLLRLALGLRPRAPAAEVAGRVRLLGDDALRTPTARLARRAGLVFQDADLQLTQPHVAGELAFRPENLGLLWRDVEARVEAAARRFGLADKLHRDVGALSGGERKRLSLAAVLAAEPEFLLLDEPLGGLDEAWRVAVVDDLRRELPGRAALVVEHRGDALAGLRPRHVRLGEGAPRPAPAGLGRTADSPWPLVLAEDVAVAKGGRGVLRGASFEAGPGVTLLVGPNGAGKTTLLRALLGLEPAEGTVRLAGADPAKEPPHRLARVVGYVPQRAEDLFAATSVREEVAAAPARLGRRDPARERALADALGLGPLLDRHPLTLSGGEQQRLALACALAHGPRVLLLDEPTVGLDAAGLARVLAAVQAARRDLAVVVASHDPGLLALADEVAVLQDGRVAYQGPPRRGRAVEVAA